MLAVLSFLILGWTDSRRFFPDAFPRELEPVQVLTYALGGVMLAAAAFGAARGPRGVASGIVFGLLCAATGWCASRWPQLSRAISLCGGVFLGLIIEGTMTLALGATECVFALALLRKDWRPIRLRVIGAALAAWVLTTAATEIVLTRIWSFGPRTLAEAADVPDNRHARRMAVAWLYPTRGRAHHIDARLMSSETVDLSPQSLGRLKEFLTRTDFRGIFAQEALAALRLGYLQWWDEEMALEAMMIAVPGRAHPDYLRALQLIRAGPLSQERYDRLVRLAGLSGRRVEGFERAGDSQMIFEGFSAAFARFGDETNARVWLKRIEGLWAVSEKPIEVGALEDLREGRVEGAVFVDGSPAVGLRVGLFYVWNSSAARTTQYWLSGSLIPNEDGRFAFQGLGPGRYVLALLGRSEDLRGGYEGVPEFIDVTYERPEVVLRDIRIVRETAPRPSYHRGAKAAPRVPLRLSPR